MDQLIKRSPSTVMREIQRHSTKIKPYSPYLAHIIKINKNAVESLDKVVRKGLTRIIKVVHEEMD